MKLTHTPKHLREQESRDNKIDLRPRKMSQGQIKRWLKMNGFVLEKIFYGSDRFVNKATKMVFEMNLNDILLDDKGKAATAIGVITKVKKCSEEAAIEEIKKHKNWERLNYKDGW